MPSDGPHHRGVDATSVPPLIDVAEPPDVRPRTTSDWAPALLGVAAFVAMGVAVLLRAPALLEPDDYAYRASIVALTQGHLTLTPAEYQALLTQLQDGTGPGIAQWVRTGSGSWVSEKNPGYPFLAAPFQVIGLLRLAPLFYGALGCLGLYVGARRWLGRWGGTYAVILFCSSGAALTFAWRATMPTFTDAALIAAGAGALVWAMLAVEHSERRRILMGLLGFVALELAVLVRYTNLVLLVVAVVAALVASRSAGLRWRAPAWWLTSVAVFGAGVLAFDQAVYGSALKTGYSSGEITFSLGAFRPNLAQMPAHLVRAMPMAVLALVAVGWLVVRLVRSAGLAAHVRASYRRDAAVGAALAAGWLGVWGVYLCYDWTVRQSADLGSSVHVVRFYLPALGLVAPLAAWLLVQLPRWVPAVVLALLVALGAWSYPQLVSGGLGAPGGPFGGPGGLPGGGPGDGFGGPPGGGGPGLGPGLGPGIGPDGAPGAPPGQPST